MRGMRGEIRDELREMRSETVSGFDTLRSETRALRTETAAELRELGPGSAPISAGCSASCSPGLPACWVRWRMASIGSDALERQLRLGRKRRPQSSFHIWADSATANGRPRSDTVEIQKSGIPEGQDDG